MRILDSGFRRNDGMMPSVPGDGFMLRFPNRQISGLAQSLQPAHGELVEPSARSACLSFDWLRMRGERGQLNLPWNGWFDKLTMSGF